MIVVFAVPRRAQAIIIVLRNSSDDCAPAIRFSDVLYCAAKGAVTAALHALDFSFQVKRQHARAAFAMNEKRLCASRAAVSSRRGATHSLRRRSVGSLRPDPRSVRRRRCAMTRVRNDNMEREMAFLVRGIGQRLQRDNPVSQQMPVQMALLIERLRQVERQGATQACATQTSRCSRLAG